MHAALVIQAKQGDREAFDALARLCGDRCLAIAFRILRDFDHADDAVQAALLTAWREIRALRDPELFEPWLHRILTNACYTEARRRRRWSEQIRLLPVEPVHGPDEYLNVEHRDQLERAFRRLTVEQRAVLVFHHYLELPLPEVAERLGIPLGTVKSRMHHAKQALRAGLEADARRPPTSRRTHTAPHDLDQELTAFLRDGPTELPDPSFDAVRDRMETTRQRVVLGPWRFPDMHVNARLAIGLAAVAVLAVVGINVLTVNRGLVAGPTASPAASAAAAPLPSPSNSQAAQVDASAPASARAPTIPVTRRRPRPPHCRRHPRPTLKRFGWRRRPGSRRPVLPTIAWARLPRNHKDVGRGPAKLWGRYLATLRQLQVPADTAADMQDLIRTVSRLQAISGEGDRTIASGSSISATKPAGTTFSTRYARL